MNLVRVLIILLGVLLIAALPWIGPAHPILGWLLLVPLIPWAIWLMVEYLRWARGLGK